MKYKQALTLSLMLSGLMLAACETPDQKNKREHDEQKQNQLLLQLLTAQQRPQEAAQAADPTGFAFSCINAASGLCHNHYYQTGGHANPCSIDGSAYSQQADRCSCTSSVGLCQKGTWDQRVYYSPTFSTVSANSDCTTILHSSLQTCQ